MDFFRSMIIAASGLRAQSGRMRVISENIANADSVGKTPGADPYRRRIASFESHFNDEIQAKTVELGHVGVDRSDFRVRFEPGHPAADEKGYVKLPNVNRLVEAMDMREAQRSYEANLNVIQATRRMISRTIDILRA